MSQNLVQNTQGNTQHKTDLKTDQNNPIFNPSIPEKPGKPQQYGRLYGNSDALLISNLVKQQNSLIVVATEDMNQALRLEAAVRFFLSDDEQYPVLSFPDWETLPYDVFSPHQDIISKRLETLYSLPETKRGLLILPVTMLMQRVAPSTFLHTNSLFIDVGDELNLQRMRQRLEAAAYICVPQVMEHGEFAVRGSILDLFPTGASAPIRIDLFDNEVESIRTFDPENQRTIKKIKNVRLMPAREFPFTKEAISFFRQSWREIFEGDPQKTSIYRDVSQAITPNGIEYYLPLFFEKTETLFNYISKTATFVFQGNIHQASSNSWTDINARYEQRRHDVARPILKPDSLYLDEGKLFEQLREYKQIQLQKHAIDTELSEAKQANKKQPESPAVNLNSKRPPDLAIATKHDTATPALYGFLKSHQGRTLFVVETEGRRQMILDMLKDYDIRPTGFKSWKEYSSSNTKLGITIATLDDGVILSNPDLALITESQLFGERVQQRRRRKAANKDNDTIIKNLTELNVGSPVVHQDMGVGRYLGLEKLHVGGFESEFLSLEYAGGDKLYVPVSSLHLISRYTGSAPEKAPLHKLGTDQWDRAKKKATERVHDVAAELLEVFAQREAARGHLFKINHNEYVKFSTDFPFEETPDQETAIESVYADMENARPMDRVVCGDVGFGKTEVAMRAAFIAANDNKQVAVLVPTTLLAQQHYQNFCDRFSDWPFRIEVLSRFKTKKQTDEAISDLKLGKIDIVIGTHKLLSDNIKYKNIGLMIVDEEHRFGVRQKEKIKAFSSSVDLLTLTATPIPRTLNMSLAGLRDLSIISTPPEHRLAVKTFVSQWDDTTLREACQREIKRGGQVYFLHNDVSSMERIARELKDLIPEAEVELAHGQMPEKQLEQIMFDFYHRRFNILVCSTIVESGIDVPTANTIIINRADKLGLAQLHQLRGRVGRSHHRAYAYLFVPPQKLMTDDAKKRIDAIESLEELGAGFMIASHDLEIRGAGELLGEEQSGQIHAIGFSLYSEMLEKAVAALKRGEQPQLDRPLDHGAEIDMQVPALIPEDYLPDVHSRLTLYKRIASSENEDQLRELQVEMIDRFGLMPDPLKNLIRVTELKLMANPLGIKKIDMNAKGGRIIFDEKPNIDPMKIIGLIQKKPAIYKLDGQTKLRIVKDLESPDTRFDAIESLLKNFSE